MTVDQWQFLTLFFGMANVVILLISAIMYKHMKTEQFKNGHTEGYKTGLRDGHEQADALHDDLVASTILNAANNTYGWTMHLKTTDYNNISLTATTLGDLAIQVKNLKSKISDVKDYQLINRGWPSAAMTAPKTTT